MTVLLAIIGAFTVLSLACFGLVHLLAALELQSDREYRMKIYK